MVRPDRRLWESRLGSGLHVDVAEEASRDGADGMKQCRVRKRVMGWWK